MTEGIRQARDDWEARHSSGVNQSALDQAAREGTALGAFEESAEEAGPILEEFFADDDESDEGMATAQPAPPKPRLADKLAGKLSATPLP